MTVSETNNAFYMWLVFCFVFWVCFFLVFFFGLWGGGVKYIFQRVSTGWFQITIRSWFDLDFVLICMNFFLTWDRLCVIEEGDFLNYLSISFSYTVNTKRIHCIKMIKSAWKKKTKQETQQVVNSLWRFRQGILNRAAKWKVFYREENKIFVNY